MVVRFRFSSVERSVAALSTIPSVFMTAWKTTPYASMADKCACRRAPRGSFLTTFKRPVVVIRGLARGKGLARVRLACVVVISAGDVPSTPDLYTVDLSDDGVGQLGSRGEGLAEGMICLLFSIFM